MFESEHSDRDRLDFGYRNSVYTDQSDPNSKPPDPAKKR